MTFEALYAPGELNPPVFYLDWPGGPEFGWYPPGRTTCVDCGRGRSDGYPLALVVDEDHDPVGVVHLCRPCLGRDGGIKPLALRRR